MYFGSVRFFKHLILAVAVLIMGTAIALAIVFGVQSRMYKNQAVTAMAQQAQWQAEDKLHIPAQLNLDEVVSSLLDTGVTASDIVSALEKQDSSAMEEIYTNHFYQGAADTQLQYDKLYPELYVTPPSQFMQKAGTIYLTFDDGPSENTPSILYILDKYDIKATFFMSGSTTERGKTLMKQVADGGHSIGVHSHSHKYDTIYQSVDSFLDDFNQTYGMIYDATGVKPDIFRFAGGSINNYNRLLYQQLIAETARRGFVYYDWNVSGQDAAGEANWTSIYNNVMRGVEGKDSAVILLHDTKYQTVTVLEDLILALKDKGYAFDKLTHDVQPTTFAYID